jgi:hypothetical protein
MKKASDLEWNPGARCLRRDGASASYKLYLDLLILADF